MGSTQPVIVIHGGAWAIPQHMWAASVDGVREAALAGFEVLKNGGSAIDAVEKSVVSLENNPAYDAGYGSVLTYSGEVELDALIMDGSGLNAGAVACIKNIKNPIKAAKLVMEKSRHVLLSGEGANNFVAEHGMETINPDCLVLPAAKEELLKFKEFHATIQSLFSAPSPDCGTHHDTVGCVALDVNKQLACGTSTGGITGKLPGRIGDSPIIGAGGLADNEIGAVSTTGNGEAISKCCISSRILEYITKGCTAQAAVQKSLEYMSKRVNGFGGAITVTSEGNVGIHCTTERMPWACIVDGKLSYGMLPADKYCQEV